MKLLLRLLSSLLVTMNVALAATLTNADIVKMSEAKLDDSIILASIENSDPKFDTSPQGLIELSTAKVPQAVISALIKRNAQTPASSSGSPAAQPAVGQAEASMSPSEVFIVDGGKTTAMRYLNPQIRTGLRALGYGGMATYAVLRNPKASARLSNRHPAFLVSVPDQSQAESYLTLASFAVRKNNTREVMIGGGMMSYSSGIHPDRIIAIDTEKLSDQSKAQKGFTIYKISPRNALPPGEYAFVLSTAEMQGFLSPWFGGNGNSYFDFGVDP